MNRLIGPIALACLLGGGCRGRPVSGPVQPRPVPPLPLPVQQLKAYPEAVTGLFASLADFEDSPGGPPGYKQVNYFTIVGTGGGVPKFVVNITRTGAAALEVTLPVGGELVFRLPYPRDFSEYTLLSLAVYVEVIRDDLEVALVSDTGRWRCQPALLRPGWNNVLFDIQAVSSSPPFDPKAVREIRLAFPHAGGPVTFNLDDVLLIDNRRTLPDTPAGVTASVSGLDYTVSLPLWDRKFVLARCPDGLWRLGGAQSVIELAAPGQGPTGGGEQTDIMGTRKIGRVEVLECNPIRLRLASVWYFPPRSGEWVSLAVGQIRWEYTFYADGRWITHVAVDNAGGREIGALRISPPPQAIWADGATGERLVQPFAGAIRNWSYLMAPPGLLCQTMQQDYTHPAEITPLLGGEGAGNAGDALAHAFDESQGCYLLTALAGHCRFSIRPQSAAASWPVFRVVGNWSGPVSVTCAGAAIRDVVSLADGSILFALPGPITTPLSVEVVGVHPASPIRAGD